MYVRGSRSQSGEPGDLPEPTYFNPELSRSQSLDTQNDSVKNLEEQGTTPQNQPLKTGKGKLPLTGSFKSKIASKSPLLAILLVLFGGVGALGMAFGPSLILVHATEIFSKDLNSQLSAYTKTDRQLWNTKLKNVQSGACGKIKIACKFRTVNVEKTGAMFSRAGIDLEFDTSKGFGENRGKITKMTHTDDLGKTTVITDPSDLDRAMEDKKFRSAMRSAYNPKFASLNDAASIGFLKNMKTSYAKKLRGNTPEELDRNMSDSVSGKTTIDYTKLRPEKDRDGNNTGRYLDENGRVYSGDTVRQLDVTENKIKSAPDTRSLLRGLAKGALITSFADTACTVYKMSNAVQTAAKLIRAREEIRYAMVVHNTVGAIKAGDATPEQVEYLGKKAVEPDMRKKIVDETAWNESGTTENPPMIDNPNYKKSGLDSSFYKMSAYQDTPQITSQNARFLAGGNGLNGTLSKVDDGVSTALGTDSPAQIRSTCKVIQNPIVRGGSLAIGIAAGVGSFGWTTALGVGGALSFAFALPYLTSMLSDMVAGEVTGPELTGTDMMDAVAVGSSAMYNGQARSHGLMPLSPEEMATYQNTNRQVQVAFAEDEALKAKETPFDIYNQYSFLGSLARQFAPMSTSAAFSTSQAISVIPKTFGLALGSVSNIAGAKIQQEVTADRYQHADECGYREMDVAVDITCVMLFGLPEEAIEIDPIENIEWMAAHDEIDIDSETGAAKDNGRDWNYKKYLENCVEQQPGAHENSIEEGNENGINCAKPEYYTQNWHYAKYKLSLTVSEGQDGNLPGIEGGSQDNFSNGEQGMVSQSGWAYPTTSDGNMTSPFGMRWGSPHQGADLVPTSGATGKPIFAARDGEVIAAGPASGFGNWIIIRHEVDGKRYDTVYGHMFDDGVFVKTGDKVDAGQQIGTIGYNGQVVPAGPGGAHLHFELWEGGHVNFSNGGKAIDPAPMLRIAHEDDNVTSTEISL